MSDQISAFFDAWEIEDPSARLEKITSAVAKTIQYDDPRTPETLLGIDALSNYVGMFSASAPGWSAKVAKNDTIGGVSRVTVAFSGKGPVGVEKVQFGQYFVEKQGELITRMVGFVGTGEPN